MDAGDGVAGATIDADFPADGLFLNVRHHLATRQEIDNGTFKDLFTQRVIKALLTEATQTVKSLCEDRRQLAARAREVRDHKPRKIIKSRKRIA